jgi:hypothetical protein
MASGEHLKAAKDFLRRHGGEMDQVDSLRISESDLAKVRHMLSFFVHLLI